MTQRELVAHLTHDPVVIEPVGVGYRIALHDEAVARALEVCVQPRIVGASSITTPQARVHGAALRLTRQEAAMVAGRVQRLIAR